MVDFVNENRQSGQFSNQIPQFIGLTVLFIVTFFKKTQLALGFLDAIQDDLFRIGNGHQAKQVRKRLVVGNFLDIGILGFVGFACRFPLIQNFKRDLPFQAGCRRFRNDPGRVKLLNCPQAGNHGGFQTGRCKHNKIMGKCGIIRFMIGKIQIQIDERSHQICFTRAHGKAEQIVCIRNLIKGFIEELFVIDSINIRTNLLSQFRCKHFIRMIGQAGILIQRSSCRIFGKILPHPIGNLKVIQIQSIKLTT